MQASLGGKRVGLVLIVCLGATTAALGPVPARADSECRVTIRVLVARPARAIALRIEGRRTLVEPTTGGVRVDGGPPQALWRGGGRGVSSVGDLSLHGRLEVRPDGSGLAVINELPLEQYVEGVLAAEIPADWAPAALQAQAVVSRTYALHQRRAHQHLPFHLEADTRSQVYNGADVPESIVGAVRATRCQVLTHGGLPILAAFHSASGGRTASAREVWGRTLAYLISQDVTEEDDSPDTYWRAGISRTTLGRALGAAGHRTGDVTQAEVLVRSESGRVALIRFQGGQGEVRLTGRALRSALGETTLKSTLFEIRPQSEGFVFVGSGRGHGVGMSQWGARGLARRGEDYMSILSSFYPGTALVHWPRDRSRREAGAMRTRERTTMGTREEHDVAHRSEHGQ